MSTVALVGELDKHASRIEKQFIGTKTNNTLSTLPYVMIKYQSRILRMP